MAFAQASTETLQATIIVEGTVRNSSGELVSGATVLLEEKGGGPLFGAVTNPDGSFAFSLDHAGIYRLQAEKGGLWTASTYSVVLKSDEKGHCDLVLAQALAGSIWKTGDVTQPCKPAADAIELADGPAFTVAGMTDWSNAGLHGSDTRARTSDALARETLALRSGDTTKAANSSPNAAYDSAMEYRAKGDFVRAREEAQKSLAIADTAAGHRLLGELDEHLGDSLSAVHEFESAARLEPSERSYLDWGAELLLHKAAQPAVQVFTKGSSLHPRSARLLAGLGASLYAAGSYDEAAQRLCDASNLSPADPAPYLFLGKMEESAPLPAACGEETLARFVQQQPESALANYYYALIVWKRGRSSNTEADSLRVEGLLEKAVRLDPQLAEAYVQLGIVRAGQGNFASAIDAYKKAIAVSPHLADAHYQLSLAYKRAGEEAKAHDEFQAYQQSEKSQHAQDERQRRELRQFVIILKDPSASRGLPPAPQQP